jgi:hypothetical protein
MIFSRFLLSKQDNNCNKPGHQHPTTTLRPSKRPTVSFTTRKTTVYNPQSSTYRPPTTSKHPHTHHTQPTRPSTSHTFTPRPTTTQPAYTQKPSQTYPTRPSSTPNPTGSGSSNLGVQPPSTRPTTPNPNTFVPGNQPPFFIIPFPFPFAPSCPCYQLEPTGNYSSENQQQLQQQQQIQQSNQNSQFQWQSQSQYAIGFIPVLFVPHCFSGNHSNQVSGQYLQVPYPCSQCNQSIRNGRELDINENYSSSDSFKQVLAQAGVDIFSNSLIKSPHRRRAKKLKIKAIEEAHLSELHEIKQDDEE